MDVLKVWELFIETRGEVDGGRLGETTTVGATKQIKGSASGRLLLSSAANRLPLHKIYSEGVVARMDHVSCLNPEGNKAE